MTYPARHSHNSSSFQRAIVAIVSGFGEGHLCGSSSLHLGDRKAPGRGSRQLPSLLRGWSVQCNFIQTWGPPFDGENHEKCWILYELRETQFDKDGFHYVMHLPHLETLVFLFFGAHTEVCWTNPMDPPKIRDTAACNDPPAWLSPCKMGDVAEQGNRSTKRMWFSDEFHLSWSYWIIQYWIIKTSLAL